MNDDPATSQESRERHTEAAVQVRRVTQVQASWTERARGEPGAFTLQLILDHGADAYILRPTAADTTALLRLFEQSGHAVFDLSRKVVVFSDIAVG